MVSTSILYIDTYIFPVYAFCVAVKVQKANLDEVHLVLLVFFSQGEW